MWKIILFHWSISNDYIKKEHLLIEPMYLPLISPSISVTITTAIRTSINLNIIGSGTKSTWMTIGKNLLGKTDWQTKRPVKPLSCQEQANISLIYRREEFHCLRVKHRFKLNSTHSLPVLPDGIPWPSQQKGHYQEGLARGKEYRVGEWRRKTLEKVKKGEEEKERTKEKGRRHQENYCWKRASDKRKSKLLICSTLIVCSFRSVSFQCIWFFLFHRQVIITYQIQTCSWGTDLT